jgi:hypothetical protein
LGKLRRSGIRAKATFPIGEAVTSEPWRFYLHDGTLIATFPPSFHVNGYVFLAVMHAHLYAWHTKYQKN